MTVEQVFNPTFLKDLSKAVDRFYDTEEGTFKEGYEFFHTAAGQATMIVVACRELGLACKVVGNSNIPDDGPHMERGTGYDWAVVNDRWIVDLWAVSYGGDTERVLYDLADPAERELAIRSFGPIDTWEVLGLDEKEIALAKEIWDNFTVPHKAVDQLLDGGLTEW